MLPFARIDFVSESLKRNPLPRQAVREELPSGWKKIESRTKPGEDLGLQFDKDFSAKSAF